MAITIWGGATARTLRAHWMATELHLDYEAKLIGSRSGALQTAEFQALNAKEKVPVLVDGDLVLSESAAIVTYLGDTYGAESILVPKPFSQARAKYNEWLSFIQMELDAHTLYVMRKHRDLAELYGEAPAAITTAIDGFNKQVKVAEACLAQQAYLLGNAFSAADLMLATCLDWALVYNIELAPVLSNYLRQLHQRPGYCTASALNFSITPNDA